MVRDQISSGFPSLQLKNVYLLMSFSYKGNHSQPRTDLIGEVSASEGHATQKHDLAMPLNSDCCSNLSVPKPTDKLIDHSTSSTESNTVLEILPRDPSQITFENGGASDVKPTVVSMLWNLFHLIDQMLLPSLSLLLKLYSQHILTHSHKIQVLLLPPHCTQ